MLEFLEGKKTYIVALLIAAFNLAVAVGWIPATIDATVTINTLLAIVVVIVRTFTKRPGAAVR